MFNTAIRLGLAVSLLIVGAASSAQAQQRDNKTVLTFSQPIEVPGQVLPAGTYTFQLADSLSDRHIVQISTADGSRLITTVLAINNYRLTATDKTVITFNEVRAGAPEAVRAWFYPGNKYGQEFVYPRRRALELAIASREVVPAITIEETAIESLKTAPLIAVTPEQRDMPVASVIQTTPPPSTSATTTSSSVQQTGLEARRELPATASALGLILLLGFASTAAAVGLMWVRKPAYVTV